MAPRKSLLHSDMFVSIIVVVDYTVSIYNDVHVSVQRGVWVVYISITNEVTVL